MLLLLLLLCKLHANQHHVTQLHRCICIYTGTFMVNRGHFHLVMLVSTISLSAWRRKILLKYQLNLYYLWVRYKPVTVCMYVYDSKPQFANLVTHPGFTDQLCYGDVSLRFMYTWSDVSKSDRERLLRQNDGLQSPVISQPLKPSHDVSTAQWVVINHNDNDYCMIEKCVCDVVVWHVNSYQRSVFYQPTDLQSCYTLLIFWWFTMTSVYLSITLYQCRCADMSSILAETPVGFLQPTCSTAVQPICRLQMGFSSFRCQLLEQSCITCDLCTITHNIQTAS